MRAPWISLVVIVFLASVAVFHAVAGDTVDWSQASGQPWERSTADHPLGTNALGQDLLSRTAAGAATAFRVGLTVAFGALTLGMLLGVIQGYAPRPVGRMIRVLTNAVDAIPFYLFAIGAAMLFQKLPAGAELAMILGFWTTTARVTATEVNRLRHAEFITAAGLLGIKSHIIILEYMVPHLQHIVAAQGAILFVAAIKVEVVLSFLGLAPDRMSWGVMLAEAGREMVAGHYSNLMLAGGATAVLALAVNRLAEWLQWHERSSRL